MSNDYYYGAARKQASKRSGKPSRPMVSRGKPATGRIARMQVGQGHGFIRLRDHREVYFHRSDSRDGTSFNELQIGDSVSFELFEDAVSGARALCVKRLRTSR